MTSLLIAYIGPGAGLSMIGTLLAVLGVLILALVAPIFYFFQFLWQAIRASGKPRGGE